MQKYAAGETLTQIGREEHRDRQTVTKIVRSEEMQEFVRQMREEFFGLAGDAVAAIRHTLQQQKDGRLGFQILATIGVIPSEEERLTLRTSEQTSETVEEAAVMKEVEKIAYLTVNRARIFGQPLPHIEGDGPDSSCNQTLGETVPDSKNDQ